MAIAQLHWRQLRPTRFDALDGDRVRYLARRDRDGVWRVQMNGATIGDKEGFASLQAAQLYVDLGGQPPRLGPQPQNAPGGS